jgi:uncharacterized protein YheU (UPF0270 family)
MIKIPFGDLSPEALRGVVDAFILREGTDYGHRDIGIDEKREKVTRLLENGRAMIYYYPENEHIDIHMVEQADSFGAKRGDPNGGTS